VEVEDKTAAAITATKIIIEQQQEKENVECVILEILIPLDQRKNIKEIYCML
jgi:hypothetical protein